jgi:hypothetical protein
MNVHLPIYGPFIPGKKFDNLIFGESEHHGNLKAAGDTALIYLRYYTRVPRVTKSRILLRVAANLAKLYRREQIEGTQDEPETAALCNTLGSCWFFCFPLLPLDLYCTRSECIIFHRWRNPFDDIIFKNSSFGTEQCS